MKQKIDLKQNGYVELNSRDSVLIAGGRLWPFFDMDRIMSQIHYGEDIPFTNLFNKY